MTFVKALKSLALSGVGIAAAVVLLSQERNSQLEVLESASAPLEIRSDAESIRVIEVSSAPDRLVHAAQKGDIASGDSLKRSRSSRNESLDQQRIAAVDKGPYILDPTNHEFEFTHREPEEIGPYLDIPP